MAFDEARKTHRSLDISTDVLPPGEARRPLNRRAEEEKELYNYYYNRIYPLLKEGKLDFPHLAYKTGYKERRIRETLLFRLTTGEVMQLFGRKEDFCYICSRRMMSANKEPMCLSCLQALDEAIQDLQKVINSATSPLLAKQTTLEQEAAFQTLHGEEDFQDTVPRAEYEALKAQVARYQEKFGPLPEFSPEPSLLSRADTLTSPTGEHGVTAEEPIEASPLQSTTEAPDTEGNPEESATAEHDDTLLQLLYMNDQDVPVDSADLPPLDDLVTHEPIRHFGFQRLKPRG